MTTRDRAYLDEITAGAEQWIRRCHGQPAAGIRVRRADLRTVLAASDDVHRDDRGWIAWRGGGQEFTAEPVPAEPPTPA